MSYTPGDLYELTTNAVVWSGRSRNSQVRVVGTLGRGDIFVLLWTSRGFPREYKVLCRSGVGWVFGIDAHFIVST